MKWMGMAALYTSLITLQFFLVFEAFLSTLVTSSTTYRPSVEPTFRQDSVSSYNVTDTGSTEFTAFSYTDTFPLLNTTRTSSPTLLVSDTSMTTSSSFSFDCRYSVYANVSQLSYTWVHKAYQWSPSAGDQLTFSAPACSALNTFRVALILFTAVVSLSVVLMMAFPIVSLILRRLPVQAADSGHARSITPQRRELWLQRLLTLLLLAVVAFAVTGLVMVVSLFVWIGRVDLPGVEATGDAVAMAVIYAVVAVGSAGVVVREYLLTRKDLRDMQMNDSSVDTSPFRFGSLLCCCDFQRRRRGDGYEV